MNTCAFKFLCKSHLQKTAAVTLLRFCLKFFFSLLTWSAGTLVATSVSSEVWVEDTFQRYQCESLRESTSTALPSQRHPVRSGCWRWRKKVCRGDPWIALGLLVWGEIHLVWRGFLWCRLALLSELHGSAWRRCLKYLCHLVHAPSCEGVPVFWALQVCSSQVWAGSYIEASLKTSELMSAGLNSRLCWFPPAEDLAPVAHHLTGCGGTFCVPVFSHRGVVPRVVASPHTDLFGETAYGILQPSQTGAVSAFMTMIAIWKTFSFHVGALLRISKGFNLLWFSPASYCILFFARLLNQLVQCMIPVLIPGEWEVVVLLWVSFLDDNWQSCRAPHSLHGLSVSIDFILKPLCVV